MTTATTTAATIDSMAHHRAYGSHSPRRWAVTLAVLALLGLAVLAFLGAELGPQAHAAGQSIQDVTVKALGGLDSTLAGIRWVR